MKFIRKLIEKFKSYFDKTKFPTICEFEGCKNILNFYSHRCNYCNKYHCEKHILAENHNCSNPQLPFEMKNGYGKKIPVREIIFNDGIEKN